MTIVLCDSSKHTHLQSTVEGRSPFHVQENPENLLPVPQSCQKTSTRGGRFVYGVELFFLILCFDPIGVSRLASNTIRRGNNDELMNDPCSKSGQSCFSDYTEENIASFWHSQRRQAIEGSKNELGKSSLQPRCVRPSGVPLRAAAHPRQDIVGAHRNLCNSQMKWLLKETNVWSSLTKIL